MLRNDLQKKGLLHRLIRLKEMATVKTALANDDYDGDMMDLSDGGESCSHQPVEMKACVNELSQYDPPPLSIPINADIRTFDWERLGRIQHEITGPYFDVIMMDPPWQLATANPTRGVRDAPPPSP